MAIQSQPSRISEPFAGSGTKNAIPATNATPSASQAASWASGFPPECSQPINAGGCPVPRNDMNGILNQLSQDYAFRQDGGVWSWSALADYAVNRVVLGSDGLLYWSVAQSGPNNGGAQNPTTDTAHTYWSTMLMPTPLLTDESNKVATTEWVRNIAIASIYIDATNGSDSNDGLSAAESVASFSKALEIGRSLKMYTFQIVPTAGTYIAESSDIVIDGLNISIYLQGDTKFNNNIRITNSSKVYITGDELTTNVFECLDFVCVDNVNIYADSNISKVKCESLEYRNNSNIQITNELNIANSANQTKYSIYGCNASKLLASTLNVLHNAIAPDNSINVGKCIIFVLYGSVLQCTNVNISNTSDGDHLVLAGSSSNIFFGDYTTRFNVSACIINITNTGILTSMLMNSVDSSTISLNGKTTINDAGALLLAGAHQKSFFFLGGSTQVTTSSMRAGIYSESGSVFLLEYFTFKNTYSGIMDYLISVQGHALVHCGLSINAEFDSCNSVFGSENNALFWCSGGGEHIFTANRCYRSFISIYSGGMVRYSGTSNTKINIPVFKDASNNKTQITIASSNSFGRFVTAATFTTTLSSPPSAYCYLVDYNSSMEIGGPVATKFPGDTAGIVGTHFGNMAW